MGANEVDISLPELQLSQENARLKVELRRQKELYENSNMELIKTMVESEQQAKQLKKLNQFIGKAFLNTIQIIQTLIELREPGYLDHSRRVAELSRLIAKKCNCQKNLAEQIHIAARIHEIGKIGIPDSILKSAPEELSEKELQLYSSHNTIGAAVLENIPGFKMVNAIIKHLRENMDGSGQPDGLKGDQIPAGSRILSMVDYFDTLFFINQEAKTPEEALKGVFSKVDTLFDARIFPHLQEVVAEKYSKADRPDDKKIHLSELKEGMVLSRDLKTITNVLLLPKDKKVTRSHLKKIVKYQKIDPIASGVYIYN